MARVILTALLMLGFATIARADVITMSEESCIDAQRGAPCEGEEGEGTCQPDTCCRLDYSQGTPPTEACNDCLTCQPGAETDDEADDGCDAGAAGGPVGLGALGLGLLLAIGLRRGRR